MLIKNLGKFLLFFSIFFNFSILKAEVYDCFTFFNELELLQLRFEELYDVVDHFVIVESPISFTGKNKPLYFYENAHQFDRFKDKIIHIVVDHFPDLTDNEEKNHWHRESYSRDVILNGLTGCKDDDVIFISDLDEIPSAKAVQEIKYYLGQLSTLHKKNKEKIEDSQLVCGLDMRLFMYFMNRENLAGWYGGSKAAPYWIVRKYTPWGIKLFHHKYAMHKISNAGWHFNTMGGMEKALEKWLNTGPIYFEGVEQCLEDLKNNPDLLREMFYNQVLSNTILIQIDASYPKYFLDHVDYFREIGWLDEESN